MSTSLASAKKRRANISEPPPQFQNRQMQQPTQTGAGMTLQQVIKLVDTRLLTLEKFMSENTNEDGEDGVPSEWMEEFNKRTEIIAVEIDSIKSSLLQLQTFTMEVNKKLFDMVMAQTPTLASVPVAPAPAPVVSEPVTAPVSASTTTTTVSEPVIAPAPVSASASVSASATASEIVPEPVQTNPKKGK
jgi:hypothetical protein